MAKRRTRRPAGVPASNIRSIIKRHPSRPLDLFYHDIGKAADAILKASSRTGTPLTTAKLAQRIGLGDATLRQTIKFSRRTTKAMAAKLQKAGQSWRGVVILMGVKKNDEFLEVYREMLAGLSNSNEIRKHIETELDKTAPPRISRDPVKAVAKVRTTIERLGAVLDGFEQAVLDDLDAPKARDRRALEKALLGARSRINVAFKSVRSLR